MRVTLEDPGDEEWKSWSSQRKRAWLADRFLWEARALLDDMHQPYVALGFTNGRAIRVKLKQPPSQNRKDYMVAAAVAVDKSILLERHDSAERGLSAVDAWLQATIGTQTRTE